MSTSRIPVGSVKEITAEEADNIIRGSWPLTAHRGVDYTQQIAECNTDDDTDALPGPAMSVALLVGLLVALVAMPVALVALIRWVTL